MNIENLCKYIRKESIYDIYLNVIKYYKGYEKISRKKMCLDILDYIKQNRIEDLITYDEYKPLLHLSNDLYYEDEEVFYKQLTNRLLAVYDLDKDQIVILDEFKKTIQQKLSEVNLQLLQDRKNQDIIVTSIIKAYGMLSIDQFDKYLNYYLKTSINDFHLSDFTYYLQFYDFKTYVYNKMILDKRFKYDYEMMHNAYLQFDNKLEDYYIPKKTLLTIYRDDINTNIKANKDLIDELQGLPYYLKADILNKVLFYSHVQIIIDDDFLSNYSYYDLDHLVPLIRKASQNIPSVIFHGLTEKQFLKKYRGESRNISAKLSNEDAVLFYKIYFGLLEYTNKKYHIQPKLKKIYKQNNLPLELIIPIRNYLFDHRKIIDEFVKKNPYHFNNEELNLISDFKYSISDLFFIMKYDHEFTYILGKNANFAIKGLYDTIEEIIPKQSLPYVSHMKLIPFKDVIIYDGILEAIPVQMMNNMKKTLNDEFKKNTTYYSIYCNDGLIS